MSNFGSIEEKLKELYIPNRDRKIRNSITTKEKTYIKNTLQRLWAVYSKPDSFQILITQQIPLFEKMLTYVGLCSKFHIVNETIHQMTLFLVCNPTIDLNRLIFKKTFPSYEFMLQQHVLYIKPMVESPQKILGDYRDNEIEVHYLIGSVVGFKIKDGPEWKSGDRIEFSMQNKV